MATGFTSGGVDFDDLFLPRGSSTAGPDCGYAIEGIDLAQRYAASVGDSDRIPGSTGYSSAGADLRTFFKKLAVGPTITSHPGNSTVIEGSSASFTVAATGSGTLTYQWERNTGSGYADFSGATSATLTVNPTSRTDQGSYRCKVTDVNGTTTSNVATLTVHYAPSITSHPSNINPYSTFTADFFVTADGNPSVSYQWQRRNSGGSWSDITGGKFSGYNTDHLSFSADFDDDGDGFRCVVTNSIGSATSNEALCDVRSPGPEITSGPSDITATAGTGPHALQCTVNAGFGTPMFSWRRDGVHVVGPRPGNISATQDQHVFNPITEADGGVIWEVLVTNDYGSDFAGAFVTVNVSHPSITSHPSNINEPNGSGPHALQCSASGGVGGLLFQWFKDGVAIDPPRAGNISATQDQHVFNPVTSGDVGTWHCKVTTPYGGNTDSSGASVSVF